MPDRNENDFWDRLILEPASLAIPGNADERMILAIERLLPNPANPEARERARKRVFGAVPSIGNARSAPLAIGAQKSAAPKIRDRRAPGSVAWRWPALAAGLLILLGALGIWFGYGPRLFDSSQDDGRIIPAALDPSNDIPLVGANAGRTNAVPGPGLATAPATLWSYATKGNVFTTPLLVDGIVYFGVSAASPADPGQVIALNANNGAVLWSHPTIAGLTADFALDDGVLFALDDRNQLYALDARSGEERWQRALRGDQPYSYAYRGAMNFAAGRLIVSSGSTLSVAASADAVFVGTPAQNYVEGDPYVTAIAPADGSVLWDVSGYPEGGSGGAFALSIEDGSLLWNHAGSPAFLGPVYDDGVVYYGEVNPSAFVALDASTGQERWRTVVSDSDAWDAKSSPSLTSDFVLAEMTSGAMVAVDRGTGEPAWTGKLFRNSPDYGVVSSVSVAGNVAVALAFGGLSGVDLTTQAVLWHEQIDVTLWVPPVALEDRVLQVAVDPSNETSLVIMFGKPPKSS